MKKVLSLILALAMVLTLFTGITVFAETGDAVVISDVVTPTASNVKFGLESWSTNNTGYAPEKTVIDNTNAVCTTSGMSIDSEIVLGVGPGYGVYNVSLSPYTTVSADNNLFMMYIRIPRNYSDANGTGREWCTESLRFLTMGVKQNGTEYHTRLKNVEFTYLAADGTAWKSGTLSADDAAVNTDLNGFEGYIVFDISTVANYSTWQESGFDADADYQISYMQFNNSQLGGACGDLAFGGFYGIETWNDGATVAQKSGSSKNYSLTCYDQNRIEATLKCAQPAALEGGTVSTGIASLSDLGYRTGTTAATVTVGDAVTPIGDNKAIVLHSDVAEGQFPYNATPQLTLYSNITITPDSTYFMLYLETPYYEDSEEWSVRFNAFAATQAAWGWGRFNNTDMMYLEKDSNEWVSTKTDSSGSLLLPSGFKGYVKINMATAEGYLNNLPNTYSFDLTQSFALKEITFIFNSVGGDYGDFVVGGVYGITKNSNTSTQVKVDTDCQKAMTSYVAPISAERKRPSYNDADSGVTLGATVSSGLASIGDLGWRSGTTQATWTYVESNEPMNNGNYALRLHTDVAEGQGPNNGTPVVSIKPYATVSSDYNTFMFYVELPKYDESSTSTSWAVRLDAISVQQNGTVFYSGCNDMQYKYIGITDSDWTDAVADSGETLLLPNGFKGYVKIDISSVPNFTGWESNGFDPNEDYGLNTFDFVFGWLGGDYGDLVIGGMYAITEDSNSIYASTYDWNYKTAKTECLTYYVDGNDDLIARVREFLDEIGEVEITDSDLVDEMQISYSSLSDAYKGLLSAEETAKYESIIAAYDAYRPYFLGTAVYMPDDTDKAGIRVGTQLDGYAAANEGYTAVEYGTVMLPEAKFGDNKNFTASDDGAQVLSLTKLEAGVTAFKWDAQYESNDWSSYHKELYFRSYVVYSDGENSITVWNSDYTNVTSELSTDMENPSIRLYIYYGEETSPYLFTSIAKAANKFGASVLAGHAYGNTDGDSDIDSNDMAVMKKRLLGVTELYRDYTADTTGDGNVNILDLIRLKKYMADSTVSMGSEKATNFTLR